MTALFNSDLVMDEFKLRRMQLCALYKVNIFEMLLPDVLETHFGLAWL